MMKLRRNVGLAFDDVLLVPKRSTIRSRSDVDTSASLIPGIDLAIPIISANMDTVTESQMAIAMAQAGGIGVIHRFMPIAQQAEEIRRVKRYESFVVESPFKISSGETVQSARERMTAANIGGLVVVDDHDRLMGMLTARDVLLAPDGSQPVQELMTPRAQLIVAPADETPASARRTLHDHRLEKLPLVDADDRVVGLITAKDIVKLQEHPVATKDPKGRLRVGAAVGVRELDCDRGTACLEAGADVLVVDVAHGHADHTLKMIARLKRAHPAALVIGGNVATPEGLRDLAEAGADAVKVGVGAGSICTTREVTGFGIPQLTAVGECAEAGHSLGVPVIADGGIRSSADVTKALAAGASTVMVGSMLAGTRESPGVTVVRSGQRFKVVRGMASLTANVDRKRIEKDQEQDPIEWEKVVPEGVEAVVPYRGSAAEILYQLVGGLRSGMSYAGAATIPELWANADFIRITPAGKQESGPHDVGVLS